MPQFLVMPYHPIQETGLLELIGADEQVAQNQYSASVEHDLRGSTRHKQQTSGRVESVLLTSTGGDIISEEGALLIFDTDPNPGAGDAALAAGEFGDLVGIVSVAATDWEVDDTAGAAAFKETDIPFQRISSLYFVYLHQGATTINSLAGDDEVISVNVRYQEYH